ncbi:oxidoreductase [Streptomyces sp. WMMC940]|uniref:oxidoreductase n=1 Tax=Streptomyces sp. WMMC940 TaxID=3015153 RepID=UPI0022B609A3|nr:oxidoreductase [Streptomyces sp. WMMC940]MCZ7456813.1 oxidoreductase [Streptomyces sp. WMMC940]
MSAEYATFALAPAVRAGGFLAGGGFEVHRDFLDFVVDGRPLLLLLSDVDAVSPLASDVPPAIVIRQVRGLLLDAEAPLPGGRHVLYGCPECEELGCGAVTAVIERQGNDVVWRDFAWQTDETADLELNGYPGTGPFRFRADAYRAALERLLDGTATGPRRRVLLVGARATSLTRLAAALRTIGIGADIARDTAGVPAEELRAYGAVVFGGTVTETERAAVLVAFTDSGAHAACVDALADVVPVVVAQVEQVLHRGPAEHRRLTGLTASGRTASVTVASACRVRLVAHRLDRLHRTRSHEVFDGTLEPGTHRIPLDGGAVRGRAFVVARAAGGVLVAAVTR